MNKTLSFMIASIVCSGCLFGGSEPLDGRDVTSDGSRPDVPEPDMSPPSDAQNHVTRDMPPPDPCAAADCGGGSTCDPMTGDCECPGTQEYCSGVCVAVGANPIHCGMCGNSCADQAPANAHLKHCADGACEFECDELFAASDGNPANGCDAVCVPTGVEVCDGMDNDCNGAEDDGLPQQTFFKDDDMDGYGDPGNVLESCRESVAGYVMDNTDCNDAEPEVHPDQAEVCDGIDTDCDENTVDSELPRCAHTVFLTSASFNGNLGSQGGPDDVCAIHGQTLEQATGTSYGNWRAIVSVGAVGPRLRIRQIGAVELPSGATVWDAGQILTFPQTLINETETANIISASSTRVWSGAGSTGGLNLPSCMNWSSDSADVSGRVGTLDITNNYLSNGTQDCEKLAHLYCINGQE